MASYLLFMCLIELQVIAILPAVFHLDFPAHATDYPNLYHPIPQKCLKSVKSSISGSCDLYTGSDRHRRKGGSVIRIHTKKRLPSWDQSSWDMLRCLSHLGLGYLTLRSFSEQAQQGLLSCYVKEVVHLLKKIILTCSFLAVFRR